MVFITAGMGGGTGTGASTYCRKRCKRIRRLQLLLLQNRFSMKEGKGASIADIGMKELQSCVDAIVVVPNDRIGLVVEKGTPMLKSPFAVANDVLRQAVQGNIRI